MIVIRMITIMENIITYGSYNLYVIDRITINTMWSFELHSHVVIYTIVSPTFWHCVCIHLCTQNFPYKTLYKKLLLWLTLHITMPHKHFGDMLEYWKMSKKYSSNIERIYQRIHKKPQKHLSRDGLLQTSAKCVILYSNCVDILI
jgi:hypothetical protein